MGQDQDEDASVLLFDWLAILPNPSLLPHPVLDTETMVTDAHQFLGKEKNKE